jgi:benzoyl-CoA reductase/2-hydroxyglutaryl-CoA dehydratase subunit BcrC/BadD/HgdB
MRTLHVRGLSSLIDTCEGLCVTLKELYDILSQMVSVIREDTYYNIPSVRYWMSENSDLIGSLELYVAPSTITFN